MRAASLSVLCYLQRLSIAMGLITSLRSFASGVGAGVAFSRASRREKKGRLTEALVQAHRGLDLLRRPHVIRSNAVEGAALVSLTVLAERVASQLHVPGALPRDASDALAYLKEVGSADVPPELCTYIAFLESRLEGEERLSG